MGTTDKPLDSTSKISIKADFPWRDETQREAPHDAGAPDIATEVDRLAKLTALDYEREREMEAKILGIRVSALDQAVKERRKKAEEEADNVIPLNEARRRKRNGAGSAQQSRSASSIDWPEVTSTGVKKRSQPNIEFFLKHVGVSLRFNELSYEVIAHREGRSEPLAEASFNALFLEADKLGLQANDAYFQRVLENVARRNAFHPLRDYLNSLVWDGVDRIGEWIPTYLGAEKSDLDGAFGRKFLIAAVRRLRQPGVKFDTVPIWEGKQGAGKSSALKALCPDEKYFTDSLTVGADQKEVIELTSGKWLVELPELDGMGKRDASTVKSMASRQTDKARLSYGRATSERHRQFVLVGTVNDNRYLRDTTGNRRFWPTKVGKECNVDAIARDRDQLWAEAAYYEAQGESLILPKDLWSAAAEAQQERMLIDPWEEILSEYMQGKVFAYSENIYAELGLDKERRSGRSGQVGQRVSAILTSMGYERTQKRDGLKQRWAYEKAVTNAPE